MNIMVIYLYYLKGSIFVILYIMLMYMIGSLISREKSGPTRIAFGYIIYSAIIGIFGIAVQVLNLPWILFFVFMCLIWLAVIVCNIYLYRKNQFQFELKNFISKYWLMIVIPLLVLFILSFNSRMFWYNDNSDGGYYLTKIATVPYAINPFNSNIAVGLPRAIATTDTYKLSVFELEASVYLYLCRIPATLFARFFLSATNYILLECFVYAFIEKLIIHSKLIVKENTLQASALATLFFLIDAEFLATQYNVDLYGQWTYQTAMYFGSALAKSICVFAILYVFIGKKLSIKNIIAFIIVCIALMSKTLTVLPMILSISLVLVGYYIYKSRFKYLVIPYAIALTIMGSRIVVSKGFINLLNYMLQMNMSSFVFALMIFMVIFAFRFGGLLKEFDTIVLLSLALMIVSPVNNLIMKYSFYPFVFCRSLAGILSAIIVLSLAIINIWLVNKVKMNHVREGCLAVFSIFLAISIAYINNGSLSNMKSNFSLYKNNPYLIPNYMIDFSNSLDEIKKKENKKFLYTLMPLELDVRNVNHVYYSESVRVAESIRQFNPYVISLNALTRFGGNESQGKYKEFGENELTIYQNFQSNPNQENISQLTNILKKYPVDCIVVYENKINQKLEEIGYKKYKTINDLTHHKLLIYYR